MKYKRLLIDQDGVLTKTVDYLLSLYNAKYFDNLRNEDVTDWDLAQFLRPECGKAIWHYMDHHPEFFQKLDPMPGCVEAFEELIRRGHNVLIVTASPRNSKTGFYDKVHWVKKHMPFFDTKNIVATHRKDVIQGDLLLDDGPHNIEAFPNTTVVFDQPWNRKVKSDYRVKSWPEFVELLNVLENS